MAKNKITYTLELDAEIKSLQSKTEQVKKSLSNLTTEGKNPGIVRNIKQIEDAIGTLQNKTATPIDSQKMFDSLQKEAATIQTDLERLLAFLNDFASWSDDKKLELLPENEKKKILDAEKAVENYSAAVNETIERSKEHKKALDDQAKAQKEINNLTRKITAKENVVAEQKEKVDQLEKQRDLINQQVKAVQKLVDAQKGGDAGEISSAKGDAEKIGVDIDSAAIKDASDLLQQLKDRQKEVKTSFTDANNVYRKNGTSLDALKGKLQEQQNIYESLGTEIEQFQKDLDTKEIDKNKKAYDTLRGSLVKLSPAFNSIPAEPTAENFELLKQKVAEFRQQGLEQANGTVQTTIAQMNEMSVAVKNTSDKLEDGANAFAKMGEKAAALDSLGERIKQFVGLQGAALVARKAVSNAVDTIKELDATMTEMAVVTDLTVGDYWDQLPQYSQQASELGVAINSAYKAATLYYQQGLRSNEVTKLSAQTLKMARIAGLGAEDATNKMTAALRGFNMELNETSAQRVADVYSELAAITAADVDEISTAMTKTASIANSANMEFETTAAFLSQIIETTRESAETAGTAMKTIIARFQELKKDPAEIGEVDGEIVDANRIEGALRSVGVSLRDASGQFRDLDDVFMELSSKWDGLDTNTQRYIATIAAGSRQQSRFIAMMSDYSRTTELVNAANTSAGASNEQFAKTLDSLESKLAKLKNAWDTFTMDLMDSSILKAGVDILVAILETINNITNAFGKFSGAAKIAALVAALYVGDKALKVFNTSLKNGSTIFQAFGKVGQSALAKLKNGFLGVQKLLAKVTGKKIVVDTKPATKALKEYTLATQNQATAAKMRQTVEQNASLSAEARAARLATLNNVEAASEQRKTAAIAEYAAAQGLTTAQASVALGLQALGIPAKIAEAAAINGLTTAKMLDYQASMVAQGLDKEVIKQRMAQIATLYAESVAEGTNTATKTTGIAALWGKVMALAASIASTIMATLATWGLVAAETAAAPPILILIIAIGILVIAIVALVAIIFALVAVFQAIQANSPEGKLNAAKEAAEVAGEAAEAAAESYQKLSDSFDSLSDKYSALEELTEGSKEWRDAVKEINSEVMDLVDQYPELANLVTSENGVLTLDIESEEAQDVLRKYEMDAAQAQAAEYAAKISVNEKQTVVDKANLSNDAKVGSEAGLGWAKFGAVWAASSIPLIGPAIGVAAGAAIAEQEKKNAENTDKMAQALAEGAIMQDENGEWAVKNQELLDELGLTADQAIKFAEGLGDGVEELKEYGEAVSARKAQEEAMYAAMASSAAQLVDTTKMTAQEIQQINNYADADYAEGFKNEALNQINEETGGMSTKEYKEWAEAEAKELYGTDKISIDDSGNVTVGEGDEAKTVSKEEFKTQLAASQATEDMAGALEKLPDAIDSLRKNLGKETGKVFEKAIADKEGKSLTQKDLNSFAAAGTLTGDFETDFASGNEIAKAWDAMTEEEREAFGSYETFANQLAESHEIATKAFAKVAEYENEIGVNIDDRLTSGAAKAFGEQLMSVTSRGGAEAAQSINAAMSEITAGLSDAELEQFYSQINAMDWSNMQDWENLPGIFEELGLSLPEDELLQFIETASDAAGAIHKLTAAAISASVQEVGPIIQQILSGEHTRQFAAEEYEQLIKEMPNLAKEFRLNLDGSYTYLGESVEQLADTIQESLGEKALDTSNRLGNSAIMADIFKAMTEGGQNVGDSKNWDRKDQENFILDAVNKASEANVDFEALGIKNFGGNLSAEALSKMSNSEIEALLDSLVQIGDDRTKHDKEQEQLYKETYGLIAEIQTPLTNIAKAGGIRGVATDEKDVDMAVGHMSTILAQATSAGLEAGLLNAYSKIIDILDDVDPGSELYQELSTYASELEDYMADALQAQEQLNEELEKFKIEFGALDMFANERTAANFKSDLAESRYERKVNNGTLTAEDVASYQGERISSVQDETAAIRSENETIGITIADMLQGEFGQFAAFDASTGAYTIDYNAAQDYINENYEAGEQRDVAGEALNEFVSTLGDYSGQYQDNLLTLEENTDELIDLEKMGEEEYSELVSQVAEGLVSQRESEIEALSEINSSITEQTSKLVESLQAEIEVQREIRDNTKTEDDIADKYSKLAYLQADTSGGNALAAAALEQEIKDAEQGYQDTLVDQSIQRLQDANDQAAEQRERQITLAENSLAAYQESNQLLTDARELLNQGLAADNFLNSSAGLILQEMAGYDQMNAEEKLQWEKELNTTTALATVYATGTGEIVSALGTDSALVQQVTENHTAIGAANSDITAAQNGTKDALITALGDGLGENGSIYGGLATASNGITANGGKISTINDTLTGTIDGSLININSTTSNKADLLNTSIGDELTAYKNFWNSSQRYDEAVATIQSRLSAIASELADQKQDEGEGEGTDGGGNGGSGSTSDNPRDKAVQRGVELAQGSSTGLHGIQSSTEFIKARQDYVDAGGNADDFNDLVKNEAEVKGGHFPDDSGVTKWKKLNDNWYQADVKINGQSAGSVGVPRHATSSYAADSKTAEAITDFSGGTPENGWVAMYDGEPYIYNGAWHKIVNGHSVSALNSGYDTLKSKMKNYLNSYETGGLADFTGPAWLDGTKSRPEYILNAAQTERFFSLVDVLESFDTKGTSQPGGDNHFDIQINVEKLESDYDVDQIANKIRQMIYEDASYRNVNAIGLIR